MAFSHLLKEMAMRKVLILLLTLVALGGGRAQAQAVVSVGSSSACLGDTVGLNLQLNTGTASIGAMSLSLRIDTTAQIAGFVLDNPAFATNFLWNVQGRNLRISWYSNSPVSSSTTLGRILLIGGSTTVQFTNVAGENELALATGQLLATTFTPGSLNRVSGTPPVITRQPRDTSVAANASPSFSVLVTGTAQYQWELSTDGGSSWQSLSGNSNYTGLFTNTLGIVSATPAMNGNRYRVQVFGVCGPPLISTVAVLTVSAGASSQLNLLSAPSCDTVNVRLQASVAMNPVGAISLTLNFDTLLAQFIGVSSPIAAINSSLLANRVGNRILVSWFSTTGVALPANADLFVFRFRNVSGGTLGFQTSPAGGNEIVNLTGQQYPLTFGSVTLPVGGGGSTATITPAGPTTFCAGGSVVLNANTGSGLSYQWLRNGVVVPGANTASFTATLAGSYRVRITAGSCSDSSAAVVVTVNAAPGAMATAAGPTTFCQGGSVQLNANTGVGFVYQWLLNNNPIAGAASSSFTASATGNYRVRITNSTGCFDTSTVIAVNVQSRPGATVTPAGPTSFCPGGSVVLNANTGTGLSYVWQRNGVNVAGATTSSIQATQAGDYRVLVSLSGGCSDTSSTVTVSLLAAPSASITLGGAASICPGDSTLLNANTGTGFSYVWLRNDTIIAGANSASLVVRTNGNYRVRITNAAGCSATSAIQTIGLLPRPTAPVLNIVVDTIFARPGTGLLWFRNGILLAGVNDSNLVITQTGYYVAQRTGGACVSDSSNGILVDAVSTGPNLGFSGWKLYPNPASNWLQMEFELTSRESMTIELRDARGSLVQYEQYRPEYTGSQQYRLQLAPLPAGIYLLRASQGQQHRSQRFVVQP